MNTRTLLNMAVDSAKMPGWNDGLSFVLKNASSAPMEMIEDDDLQMVAGGVNTDDQLVAALKEKLGL